MLARITAPDSLGPGPARAGPAGCCAGDPLCARAGPVPLRLVGRDGSHPLCSPFAVSPQPASAGSSSAAQLGCLPWTASLVPRVPPHHLPCAVPSPGGQYSFPSLFLHWAMISKPICPLGYASLSPVRITSSTLPPGTCWCFQLTPSWFIPPTTLGTATG